MHAKNSTLNTRLLQYYFAKKGLSTGRDKENTRNAIKVAREDAKENYSEGGRFKSGCGNLVYFELCLHLYEESRAMVSLTSGYMLLRWAASAEILQYLSLAARCWRIDFAIVRVMRK